MLTIHTSQIIREGMSTEATRSLPYTPNLPFTFTTPQDLPRWLWRSRLILFTTVGADVSFGIYLAEEVVSLSTFNIHGYDLSVLKVNNLPLLCHVPDASEVTTTPRKGTNLLRVPRWTRERHTWRGQCNQEMRLYLGMAVMWTHSNFRERNWWYWRTEKYRIKVRCFCQCIFVLRVCEPDVFYFHSGQSFASYWSARGVLARVGKSTNKQRRGKNK